MEPERMTLVLKEYLPPDCTCAVEDRVRGVEGVLDAAVIPVDELVQVHRGSSVYRVSPPPVVERSRAHSR